MVGGAVNNPPNTDPSFALQVNGEVGIAQTTGTAGRLRFYAPNLANFTGLRAQNQSADVTYLFPAAVPTDGAALVATAPSSNVSTLSWRPRPVETEIDFGTAPTLVKSFTVTDSTVVTTSLITAVQSGNAATSRQADENEMDRIMFAANPGTGTFTLYATSAQPVSGKYKVIYAVQ